MGAAQIARQSRHLSFAGAQRTTHSVIGLLVLATQHLRRLPVDLQTQPHGALSEKHVEAPTPSWIRPLDSLTFFQKMPTPVCESWAALYAPKTPSYPRVNMRGCQKSRNQSVSSSCW